MCFGRLIMPHTNVLPTVRRGGWYASSDDFLVALHFRCCLHIIRNYYYLQSTFIIDISLTLKMNCFKRGKRDDDYASPESY